MKAIEIIRATSNGRRPRRVRALQERRMIEVKYRRAIVGLVRQIERDAFAQFKSQSLVLDAVEDDFAAAFRNLRAIHLGTPDVITSVVRAFTNEAEEVHRQRFFASLRNAFGIDLADIIEEEGLGETLLEAVNDNVNLITSVAEEYLDNIEQAVFQNLAGGGDGTPLLDVIRNVGDVSESRARLIARDQNSKLNASLTQARQEALGVEEYRWITSRDDRVRETHRDNNGKIFKWSQRPRETGHPGEDIQCRCIAQPII